VKDQPASSCRSSDRIETSTSHVQQDPAECSAALLPFRSRPRAALFHCLFRRSHARNSKRVASISGAANDSVDLISLLKPASPRERRIPPALPFDKDKPSNFRISLHRKHPWPPLRIKIRKSQPLKVAGFYAATQPQNAAAPWPNIAPARTALPTLVFQTLNQARPEHLCWRCFAEITAPSAP